MPKTNYCTMVTALIQGRYASIRTKVAFSFDLQPSDTIEEIPAYKS